MNRVNLTYARAHLSELVDRVHSGEEVVISRRGSDVARLIPIHEKTPKEPLPLKELAEFRSKMPKLRSSAAESIRQMRDESR